MCSPPHPSPHCSTPHCDLQRHPGIFWILRSWILSSFCAMVLSVSNHSPLPIFSSLHTLPYQTTLVIESTFQFTKIISKRTSFCLQRALAPSEFPTYSKALHTFLSISCPDLAFMTTSLASCFLRQGLLCNSSYIGNHCRPDWSGTLLPKQWD